MRRRHLVRSYNSKALLECSRSKKVKSLVTLIAHWFTHYLAVRDVYRWVALNGS